MTIRHLEKQIDELDKSVTVLEVLEQIRAEIIQMPTISSNANDIYKADVLAIVDKHIYGR